VATFAKEFDLKFPLLIDAGGKLAGSLDIHYFPSTYLVEDGVITKSWRGVIRDEADFRHQLLTEN
jgi:peroxiredoxin